jgi:type VI secretion system secreted protein VgrG
VSGKASLFAAQGGIKQVAAKGKFEMQAQSDAFSILAKQNIQIISTEDRIEITSPKEIVITAGGSQIKLNGSGIFPTTGGKFEVKAGQHVFTSGANVNSNLPQLPKSKSLKGALELLRTYGGDNFFKQNSYKVIDSLGKQLTGKLDANGFAQVTGIAPGAAKVIFEKDETSAWAPSSDFKRDYTWAEPVGNVAASLSSALGQNMKQQLTSNLLSMDKNSLKNIGKNTLNNLAEQTVGQIKDQVSNTALSVVSKQLNLNISPEQIKSLAQIAKDPNQSIEMIKAQGMDLVKDRVTAKLMETAKIDSVRQQDVVDYFHAKNKR